MDDLLGKDGGIKKLIKNAVDQMLQCEMTEHLGYEKHAPEGINTGNNRNGVSPKSLKSDLGKIENEITRDRNWRRGCKKQGLRGLILFIWLYGFCLGFALQ